MEGSEKYLAHGRAELQGIINITSTLTLKHSSCHFSKFITLYGYQKINPIMIVKRGLIIVLGNPRDVGLILSIVTGTSPLKIQR